MIPELDISETLPHNTGEHAFPCHMQMYRGVLKVE
ncbi:MAG: plastocyanin domain-containing protein [Arenicella sp.]|jgi:plastocyanin domain-containing protein